MWYFTKMDKWKRKLASKDEKCSKEMKNDNSGREICIEYIWNYISNSWTKNVDTVAIWKTLDIQPGELSEKELTDLNEQSGCD